MKKPYSILGGISALFLLVAAIAMIVFQYGSPYWWGAFLLIAFLNAKAIRKTFDSIKYENAKTKALLAACSGVVILLIFGVVYYIK